MTLERIVSFVSRNPDADSFKLLHGPNVRSAAQFGRVRTAERGPDVVAAEIWQQIQDLNEDDGSIVVRAFTKAGTSAEDQITFKVIAADSDEIAPASRILDSGMGAAFERAIVCIERLTSSIIEVNKSQAAVINQAHGTIAQQSANVAELAANLESLAAENERIRAEAEQADRGGPMDHFMTQVVPPLLQIAAASGVGISLRSPSPTSATATSPALTASSNESAPSSAATADATAAANG